MKLQSALEFLSTYAFMLVLVAFIIIIIFYLAFPVQSTVPSQCNILGGLQCSFALYHPNTGANTANMIFYITNSGSAPINVISANVIISNKTFTGTCTTSLLNPGSASVCYSTVSPSSSIGSQVKGYISISADICNSGVSQFGNSVFQAQCSYIPVSYTGEFFTYSSYITANTIATTSIYTHLSSATLTPAAPAIDSGQSITLAANPSGGEAPYTYTWYAQSGCSGTPTGSSSASSSFSPSATTTYSVNVVDSLGAYSCSSGDTVAVNPALSVSISPSSETVSSGSAVSFTGTVSGGTSTYSYQWYSESGSVSNACSTGTAISGAISSSYTTPALSSTTSYCLAVTDSAYSPSSATSATSAITILTVCTNLASGTCNGDIVYASSTSLTGTVTATNMIYVESGVTLTTEGYSLIAGSLVTNQGTISAGSISGSGGSSPESFTSSYSGSGGGGGGGKSSGTGTNGGSTTVSGGTGGTSGNNGRGGTTPSAPSLSQSLVDTISSSPTTYLNGAGGGSGGNSGGTGGSSAYGIYIQGAQIIAGTITATGSGGGTASGSGGGGGGGGGGSILLAYGTSLTSGTYTLSGGTGSSGVSHAGSGGNGGAGQALTFKYTTPPITP